MKGILLVDKPTGLTSHDAVDHIRRAARIRRVGHTGTLDPAATGLLILCLGPATRLSQHLVQLDKVYEGAMRLGLITDSHDLDGAVVQERPVPEMDTARIQGVFNQFVGDIMQVPPMVSAVKIGGQRLYKMARKGQHIQRPARPVTIHELTLLGYDPPHVHFRTRCTRGTYVRSLCHDIGQALGCGATLASLRRTWVGHHSVEDAQPLDAFVTREQVLKRLLPMEKALNLPEITVRPESVWLVAAGNQLTRKDIENETLVEKGWVQLKSESGELLALAEICPRPGEPGIRPRRVFCN